MNKELLVIVERIPSVWDRFIYEVSLSDSNRGELRHLALALLLDDDVSLALRDIELPTDARLRKALTDAPPLKERIANEGSDLPSPDAATVRVRVLYGGSWQPDEVVWHVLDDTLSDNELSGSAAALRLLDCVLRDERVAERLTRADVDVLTLRQVVARHAAG